MKRRFSLSFRSYDDSLSVHKATFQREHIKMSLRALSNLSCLWLRSSRRHLSCLVPAGTPEEPTRTSAQVVEDLTEAIVGGGHIDYDPKAFEAQRRRLMSQLPSSQDELPARRMADSFDQALLPLGSDSKLRDKYLTHFGSVRVGRLLEDMDVFAAHLVFKHVLNPKQDPETPGCPFSIVTALVDRIDVKTKIAADKDLKMLGHVTWVGRSSAETKLELHQRDDDGERWHHVTSATFVFVVRDTVNKGSSFINKLIAETEAEKALVAQGERNRAARLASATDSLFKNPPSEWEKRLIHDFFIQTVDHKALSFKARVKPENSEWMENAKLKNIIICQPENRNRFNKIFGGFIMRQAFELAWANTVVYARKRPHINFMDDISFKKPVEIGSLLYFNSQICYTEGNQLQTRVSAEVLDPTTGQLSLTNVFQYTFSLGEEAGDAPKIIPKTYHEAMLYLEGRRHFIASTQHANNATN